MMRGTSTGAMIRILLVFWATFAPAQQFEFGDIVSVARSIMNGRIVYTHWAVYVGLGPVEGLKGKNDNQDIFHITGPVIGPGLSNCVFGQRGNNEYIVSNYLDIDENGNNRPINDRAEMIRRINELHLNCGTWKLFSHNCEHVATSIRYGFQNCEQRGTRLPEYFRKRIVKEPEKKAGKRSLMDLLDRDSSLAAAGA